MDSDTEDVMQWLPDHSQARTEYDLFESKFGADDFLIATWPDCTIDDPRLEQFTTAISKNDPADLIKSVTTGREVSQRLRERLDMSQSQISRRLKGIFFGANNPEQTCAFIQFSLAGMSNRTGAVDVFWQAIESVPGLSRDSVVVGGYPFVATTIDDQLKNSLRYFLAPSILLSTVLALLSLRHVTLTAIVFATAILAATVSMALVPIFGFKFGGLMSIIPALVFVLTTSGSLHLVRYSLELDTDPESHPDSATQTPATDSQTVPKLLLSGFRAAPHNGSGFRTRLLQIGWKPCAVSTLTTAIGMLSLTRSEFPAIRNFGFFCATGVGCALAFQLVMVPWLLSRFGQHGIAHLRRRADDSRFWENCWHQISRFRYLIVVTSLTLMLLGGWGLTRLKAQVEVEKLFWPDSPVLKSLAALERDMGPLDQTEVLLRFSNPDPLEFPDRVDQIRRIQFGLMALDQVQFAHSLINYLPLEPGKSSARSFAKRSAYRSLLKRERENLANGNFLIVEPDQETWRISLKFPFTERDDFENLKRNTETVVASVSQNPDLNFSHVPELVYTGKTYLFNSAQQSLLRDLFWNFLLAFVIITPVLVIALRSIPLGLLAMIPNLFPTLIVFGGLGWLGYPADLAIAMTASIALGIAVDDTTHFLIRFRDFGGSLSRVSVPVLQTISQCGPAMVATTLIGCGGLIVYYFGDMLVVSKFALAISSLLLIALLADVLMLPAILKVVGRDEPTPTDEPMEPQENPHEHECLV